MANRLGTLRVHPNRLICDILAPEIPMLAMELDAANEEFRFCPVFSGQEGVIVPVNVLMDVVVDCAIAQAFEVHLGSKWDVMAEE